MDSVSQNSASIRWGRRRVSLSETLGSKTWVSLNSFKLSLKIVNTWIKLYALKKWSSITHYASSPNRYNPMLFLKVMNIVFLKVKNITSVLSSGGTRNFGGIEGQNAILRGQKSKTLPKMTNFGNFFFWRGGGGKWGQSLWLEEMPPMPPLMPPLVLSWLFSWSNKKIILSKIFAGLCFKRCKMATYHSLQQLQLQNKI